MAIKTSKEINEFIKLVANIFDTYTAAYFSFDKNSNYLKLKYFHSLSNNIKKNCVVEIGKSLKTWLIHLKKPVELKESDTNEYSSIFTIYSKKENIKTFFAVPVGNYDGLLYIDSKRSYSFPEKHQRLLFHCSEIINQFIKIDNAAKNIRFLIDYTNLAKMIKTEINKLDNISDNIATIIEILSEFLGFEYGVLVQNCFKEGFKFLDTNLYKLKKFKNRKFMNKDTIVNIYFSKTIKSSKFFSTGNMETVFFSEKEEIKKEKLKNYWYFPFFNGNNVIGAFLFFNIKRKYDYDKLYLYLYDILYPIIYEILIKEQLDSLLKFEPYSGLMRDFHFLNYIGKQNFLNSGLMFIEVINLSNVLKRNSLHNILKSYRILKKSLDNILDYETVGGFFSLGKLGLIYPEIAGKDLNKKKNLIIKNFESRIINVNNSEIHLDLKVEIFNNIISDRNNIIKKIN